MLLRLLSEPRMFWEGVHSREGVLLVEGGEVKEISLLLYEKV